MKAIDAPPCPQSSQSLQQWDTKEATPRASRFQRQGTFSFSVNSSYSCPRPHPESTLILDSFLSPS